MPKRKNGNCMNALEATQVDHRLSDTISEALAPAEYGFYFTIFYSVFGPILGLILMGGIGTGFLLIPVLGLCAVGLGPQLLFTMKIAWMPLACGVSYFLIQLVVHGESMYGNYIYQFGPWLISLVIVQALVMHRPGFLHRFAWFTMLLALGTLPFMSLHADGQYERLGVERGVGNSNSNAIAAWFGFCALYLTFRGYIERRPAYRVAVWLIALVCLYIVTLTISRGALIAIAASVLVASRRLLKVGILPLLLLVGIMFGLLELGVFDQAFQYYSLRAGEETGRLRVWPMLIDKFLSSPLIGVGASHTGAFVSTGKFVTPHNSFLLFAVASGIVPLVFFCAYCFGSIIAAIRAKTTDHNFIYYLPLSVYAVLITCAGNLDFMEAWAVVSLALPFAAIAHQTNGVEVPGPSAGLLLHERMRW
jgi:hypothetical protein